MNTTLTGIVIDGTIRLDSPIDLPDGFPVRVTIATEEANDLLTERIRRCAGSLADLPQSDWDDLDTIVRQRRDTAFREVEE